MTKFIHFRTQSSFSMLENSIKIDELVKLTKQHNMPAVCLSDRGNLFGSLEFSLTAAKAEIQPIHGSILNLLFKNNEKENFAEILVIAKDSIGYKNLLKLVSYTFTKNDRKICNHITFKDLEVYNEGIIVLSAYTEGVIGKFLQEKNYKQAKLSSQKFKNLFGNRFYFEIMRHGLTKEKQIEDNYLKIATELEIPLIATNQVLFSDISMHDAHDVLLCISDGVTKDEQNRRRVSNQCYFKSVEEMAILFNDLPEAVENTINLMQRCYVMAETQLPALPNFSSSSSEADLIKKEATLGLEKRLQVKFKKEKISLNDQNKIKASYLERLNYELNIICEMNFSGYFLIVSDFIKWSKENKIAVGPGRGSGAGSIIAWALQITDLDPIKFGLLFERFLNPERVSMPDFDIDFCQERREEVISYVRSKYGDDRVGQIITFGKMQAKAVIKDVSRVLGLSYVFADYLTELVPFNAVHPVTLSQAINDVAELRNAANGKGLYNLDGEKELIKQVLATSLVLEGLHRHASTHAAGVVIANQSIIETVPIYKDINSDMLIVQYSMKYSELAGLIKFDFLGLQTLTVITKCLYLLSKRDIIIDLEKISFEDKKTYKILSEGMSTGIFQFESAGMKSALRRLKPDNIEDIIALGALYRPGPMDNIPTYIACKHGQQEVDYLHPMLEPILKSTYGVIIYQEQVMEIALRLSNYSLGAADLLRRAMGKKVKAEMSAQEAMFVNGAKTNGVSSAQASSIFATVAKFAGYGFNKSHASAYGVISYQTAYLKANFTAEFLVASLNLDIDNSDKINLFLEEAKKFNINIIAPCINISKGLFSIQYLSEKDKGNNIASESIIFALGAIKNVTVLFGEAIEKQRNKHGPFKSIINFIERIDPKLINKRLLENIIRVGCFDLLHNNRNGLLKSIPKLMAYASSFHKEKKSNQFSLITISSNSNDILIESDELNSTELAFGEFEVTGLFLNNHPLSHYKQSFEKFDIKDSNYINNELNHGSYQVRIAGIIIKKDARMSPKGRFITLTISDPSGITEVTIFSEEVLKNYAHLLNVRDAVIINCDIYKDLGRARITARSLCTINDVIQKMHYNLKLYPKDKNNLNIIINLLNQKINIKNNNSSIFIFLTLEQGFLLKICMPNYFFLNDFDSELLQKL